MNLEALQDKRVTFFVPETPPSFAGAGINAFYFAKFISTYTRQTTLCQLNYNRKQKSKDNIGKLKLVRIAYFNYNLLTKIGSLPYLLLQYFRQVLFSDIIFVYSGYMIGFQFIIIIASLLDKKIIFRSSILGGDDISSLLQKNNWLHILNRCVFKRLSLYFAINPEFSNRVKNHLHIPVFESYQGVDNKRFQPLKNEQKKIKRMELGLKITIPLFLSVGILLNRKGYKDIFNTLAKIDDAFIYIILGEYLPGGFPRVGVTERREMRELYLLGKQLLGEKLVFAGTTNSVEDYYHASDIFIHAAEQEGTPNVLLEAMACGLPCVIRDIEGISGHLAQHNENVYVFSNNEDLHSVLGKWIRYSHERQKIALTAAKTISENYTFEQVAIRLFNKVNE